MLLPANKAAIAEAIRQSTVTNPSKSDMDNDIPVTDHYVLDGGSLLHRLTWKNGETYGSIAEKYASFTVRNYKKATVVFDGYSGEPTVKDNAHQTRQQKQNLCPIVKD